MKTLTNILAVGAFALLMSACGGSDNNSNLTVSSSCAAGSTHTVQGCVASTQTCNQNGTNAPGVWYNNQCVPTATAGAPGSTGTTCPYLFSTQYNTCLTQSPQCGTGYGLNPSTNSCVAGVVSNNNGGYNNGGYNNGGYNNGYNNGSCINVNVPNQGVQCLSQCQTPGQVLYNGMCYNLIPLNNGYSNGSSYYYYSNGQRSYNYGYTGGFHIGGGFGF